VLEKSDDEVAVLWPCKLRVADGLSHWEDDPMMSKKVHPLKFLIIVMQHTSDQQHTHFHLLDVTHSQTDLPPQHPFIVPRWCYSVHMLSI
jgi:hypothetical protein